MLIFNISITTHLFYSKTAQSITTKTLYGAILQQKLGSKILRSSLLPSVDPPACVRLICSFYNSSSCWPLETGSELAAERQAPKIRGGKIRAVSWQQGWMQRSVSWEPWKCNGSCVIWTIPLWFKEVLCT